MQKDDLNVHVFQNGNWEPFHRKEFKWKKMWGYWVSFWKMEASYAEFNERVKAATSSYSGTGEFLQYIYSAIVTKNHQNIRSRCLVHEFSFTDIFLIPFYMAVASYCFYEWCAKRCALHLYRTFLSIFILFQLQSWIILRVRMKFLQIFFYFSCEESDYGDSDDEDIEQRYIW